MPKKPSDILKELEKSLRTLIESELTEISPDWWKQRIPQDVRDNATDRKTRNEKLWPWQSKTHKIISYVDFTDYGKIITRNDNWNQAFKGIFLDKNWISIKLKELEPIRNSISHSRSLSRIQKRLLELYAILILGAIKEYKKNKVSRKATALGMESKTDILSLVTSCDRTIYPLNSVVYIRVALSAIIPWLPVEIEIYDSSKKLVSDKKIDLHTGKIVQLESPRIYETSITMQGIQWKVDHSYLVKAKHGVAESYDVFTIDDRLPVVQSDRSVYNWKDEMILTVIDPDADKDSNKVEYVGDRSDSKLIIPSSKGKLENYRLKETGDNTGIFQGILGFVGISNDGSVVGNEYEGKTITKTQGHEVDDGFIEVGEEEEMEITYSNCKGTAKLTVFVLKETG